MKTSSRLLAIAAIGAGVALLLNSKKGRQLTRDLRDTDWTHIWNKYGNKLSSLRNTLDHEIDGLTSDARRRILAIIDDAQEKNKVGNHM